MLASCIVVGIHGVELLSSWSSHDLWQRYQALHMAVLHCKHLQAVCLNDSEQLVYSVLRDMGRYRDFSTNTSLVRGIAILHHDWEEACLPRKEWLLKEDFPKNAASSPHVHAGGTGRSRHHMHQHRSVR